MDFKKSMKISNSILYLLTVASLTCSGCMTSHSAVLRKWSVPGGGEVYLERELISGYGIDVRYVMHFRQRGEDSECEPRIMPNIEPGCDYFLVKKSTGLKLLVTDSGNYSIYDLGSGKIKCLDGGSNSWEGIRQVILREASPEFFKAYDCAKIDCVLQKVHARGCKSVIELY